MRRFQTITVAFTLALQAMPVSAFAEIQALPTVVKKLTPEVQLSQLDYELDWETARKLIPGLKVVQDKEVKNQIKIYGLVPADASIQSGMKFSFDYKQATKRLQVGLKVTGDVKRALEQRLSSGKACADTSADCISVSKLSTVGHVSWTGSGEDAAIHWSHHLRNTDPSLEGDLKEHDLKIQLKSDATLAQEELAKLKKEQEATLKLLNCPTCLNSKESIDKARAGLENLCGFAEQLQIDVEKITAKINDAEFKLLMDQAKKVKAEDALTLMADLRAMSSEQSDEKRQQQLARAYEQVAYSLYSSKSEDELTRASNLAEAASILEEAKGLNLNKDMQTRIKGDLERVKVEQESNELIPLAKEGLTQNIDLQERLKKIQEDYMQSCGARGSKEKCQYSSLLMTRAQEIQQMAVGEERRRYEEAMAPRNPISVGIAPQAGPFGAPSPGTRNWGAGAQGVPPMMQNFSAPISNPLSGFGMPSSMGTPAMPGLSGFGQGQAPSMMGGQTPQVNFFPSNSGFGQAR